MGSLLIIPVPRVRNVLLGKATDQITACGLEKKIYSLRINFADTQGLKCEKTFGAPLVLRSIYRR